MARESSLGKVAAVSPRGDLLLRAPDRLPVRLPGGGGAKDGVRIGAAAADARREYVGRIADIIGPVARPYVVVQPPKGAKLHRLVGQELYASDAPPPRRPGPPSAPGGGRSFSRGPPTGGRPRDDRRGPPPGRGGDARRGPPRGGGRGGDSRSRGR